MNHVKANTAPRSSTEFPFVVIFLLTVVLFVPLVYAEWTDGQWPDRMWRLLRGRALSDVVLHPSILFAVAAFSVMVWVKPRHRPWLLVPLLAAFLRLTASDLPLLIAGVLLLGYAAIGFALFPSTCRSFAEAFRLYEHSLRLPERLALLLLASCVGGVVYAASLALLSIFVEVDLTVAWILMFALAVPAILLAHRRKLYLRPSRGRPDQPRATEDGPPGGVFDRFCLFVVLLSVSMILSSIGNPSGIFDAEWYGTSPAHVMPTGHFFEPTHLQHFVYYYPKGFELLTYPLKLTASGAELQAFNALLAVLTLGTMAAGVGVMAQRPPRLIRFLAFVLSYPVVHFMIIAWKPDFAASALAAVATVMMLVSFKLGCCRPGQAVSLAWLSVFFLCLALSFKLTVYLAAPLLAVLWLTAMLRALTGRRRSAPGALWRSDDRAGLTVALMGFLFLSLVILRTYLTSGIPVFRLNLGIFETLPHLMNRDLAGLVTRDRGLGLEAIPQTLWDMLYFPSFSPTHVDRPLLPTAMLIVIAPLAWLTGAVFSTRRREGSAEPGEGFLVAVSAVASVVNALFLLALVFYLSKPGGDANYFLYPVLIGCMMYFLLHAAISDRAFAWVSTVPILIGIAWCFLVFAHASRFDPRGFSSWTRHHEVVFLGLRESLADAGAWGLHPNDFQLAPLLQSIEAERPRCRGYWVAEGSKPMRFAHLLPCAVEGGGVWLLDHLLNHSGPDPMASVDLLIVQRSLMTDARTSHLEQLGWNLAANEGAYDIWQKLTQ